jgi:hypothetical protein
MRGSEERRCPSPSPARDHHDIARPREIEPTGLKQHNAPTTVDGEQPHMEPPVQYRGPDAREGMGFRACRQAPPSLSRWTDPDPHGDLGRPYGC